jgi:hypothetical protein
MSRYFQSVVLGTALPEVADALVALLVHPARQAILHLFDDAEAMQHGRRAHLHAASAQRHEFGRIAPVADAADAGNRQARVCGSRAISATMFSAIGFTAEPQ